MVAVAIVLPVIVAASVAIMLAFALFDGDASERWARYLPTIAKGSARPRLHNWPLQAPEASDAAAISGKQRDLGTFRPLAAPLSHALIG
jgi:hypothetical protein